MWNKKFDSCKACGSIEWEYKAKGYCKKCYPLIQSVLKVNDWDENIPSSLKEIPGFNTQAIESVQGEMFSKAKAEIKRQLESRLNIIKNSVNPENITPLSIEYTLNEIAEIILKDQGKSLFHGHAGSYQLFSDEQLITIYKDLNYILLKRRFSLDLNKIYFNHYGK